MSEDVRRWLQRRADEHGVDVGTFVQTLLAEHRDLDELESEFRSLIEDVRSRVIQVKREADGKAPADHTHESVLEYLLETTDDLADRTDRLARATIGTRKQLQELSESIEAREAADRLKRDAALEGIATADCEDCGQTVRAGLLTSPDCPYCAASFVDVEPKQGLLGSATFVTGQSPALTGSNDDPVAEALQADVERDRPDPADVDWDTAGDDDT